MTQVQKGSSAWPGTPALQTTCHLSQQWILETRVTSAEATRVHWEQCKIPGSNFHGLTVQGVRDHGRAHLDRLCHPLKGHAHTADPDGYNLNPGAAAAAVPDNVAQQYGEYASRH